MSNNETNPLREKAQGVAIKKSVEFAKIFPSANTYDYRRGFEEGVEWVQSLPAVEQPGSSHDEKTMYDLLDKDKRMRYYVPVE